VADPERAAARRESRPSGPAAAVQGAQQLVDLTGREFEGIVGLTADGDGWSVEVEVLEMRRIPTTTDVLALYQVDVDASGTMVGYRRIDRYLRGAAGEERS